MAAGVAGFSAAMERDEEGTFAQVQGLRLQTRMVNYAIPSCSLFATAAGVGLNHN